jgi:ABC-type multidrug transport system fused ATPase/permease subunit
MNLLSIFVLACALQEPIPDPIPDAVGASVVDVIVERRIESLLERLESQQSTIIERAAERIEQRTNGKIADLVDSVKSLREDREGVMSSIKEFRKEHGTLMERMTQLADSVANSTAKWTPIQNLVDRLTALVWKLFWFICVLCGLMLFLALVGLFLYSRLKGFVSKEISSIVPSVLK